jgi:hypothetical protein
MEPRTLKSASSSAPKQLAGAIAGRVRAGEVADVDGASHRLIGAPGSGKKEYLPAAGLPPSRLGNGSHAEGLRRLTTSAWRGRPL